MLYWSTNLAIMALSRAGVSYSLFLRHSLSGVLNHLYTITLSAHLRLPSMDWRMPRGLTSDTYSSDENTLPWSEFWTAGVPCPRWAASEQATTSQALMVSESLQATT